VLARDASSWPELVVSVVNSTETAQDCKLTVNGVDAGGPVLLWQLAAPSATETAQPAQDPFGFGPPAKLAESTLAQAPKILTVPAACINVYELQVLR
jgi:hypothetical protein